MKTLGLKAGGTQKDSKGFPKAGMRVNYGFSDFNRPQTLFTGTEMFQRIKLLHAPFRGNELNVTKKTHCEPLPFKDTARGKSFTPAQANPNKIQLFPVGELFPILLTFFYLL